jgi:hypothetical protein
LLTLFILRFLYISFLEKDKKFNIISYIYLLIKSLSYLQLGHMVYFIIFEFPFLLQPKKRIASYSITSTFY